MIKNNSLLVSYSPHHLFCLEPVQLLILLEIIINLTQVILVLKLMNWLLNMILE